MNKNILIVDCGSQVTQLIARRIREIGIYTTVINHNSVEQDYLVEQINKGLAGIIISGSHESINKESPDKIKKYIFKLGIPVLGICYGMQSMANQLGGEVSVSTNREYGHAEITISNESELLGAIQEINPNSTLKVWMSHGDTVTKLPDGFKKIAHTNSAIAGMENNEKKLYALQFHPEVTHTELGKKILERFVINICNCQYNWDMPSYIEQAITNIKSTVGNDKVILGLSGGVDSSVAAVLINKAIGKKLTCIFVDHGLMRLNEKEQVKTMFSSFDINVIYCNASELFLKKLEGVTDPEKKRKIIGNEFINVFQEEAKKIGNVKWLAQGTIYPDIIESSKEKNGISNVIKSHHNVGGLPEKMNLSLLEPLKYLFKDEVRKIGIELGIPYDMICRHPFPGPGLAVRIIGEIKEEFIKILQSADNIFIDELKSNKNILNNKSWYDSVSQAFAVFLPIKSVGVMGDGRTYEYVIVLRSVDTSDFMTANWSDIPASLLSKISSRIINEVSGINRVVYDISNKPPSTIEWE
ncbi:glutamine-hydrolyzing GMP synthase [Candidatus Kinetoplastidibacterium crithidiae]|uniref:GMP synthase [glutamine-hydrolyzing] n=1 Tax=Candidatus Kinetoplastidibacterium crithidiae TCC036E TaxID=1208918 RepID=M1LWP0_9PROT|nr:glutamine-hydrolyzing GMP synthase [Candidatus Kinetoplastibacterium crithidii]AFZ82714.1 GMP synthase [Candidatus Kinetoplastibacterium crithidii (ex Angomonas deanei ATCC 30255)]AGF47634.1 glutamine-hydrolysing GMP synthase [Candidatus Kinetoplastibacterium crithidii TCC036E]